MCFLSEQKALCLSLLILLWRYTLSERSLVKSSCAFAIAILCLRTLAEQSSCTSLREVYLDNNSV